MVVGFRAVGARFIYDRARTRYTPMRSSPWRVADKFGRQFTIDLVLKVRLRIFLGGVCTSSHIANVAEVENDFANVAMGKFATLEFLQL